MQNTRVTPKIDIARIIGGILLVPPVFSVILFIRILFSDEPGIVTSMENLSAHWTGDYASSRDGGSGGYTSAAPIYLGLMAIGGAILFRKSEQK